MRSSARVRSPICFLGGCIVGALLLSAAAYAVTAPNFTYSTPQVGALSIPAAAFGVETTATQFTNNGLIAAPASGSADFIAPLNLPQGASLNSLTIYVKPTSGDLIFVELGRQRLSDGDLEFIVFQEPSGTSGTRTALTYPIEPAKRIIDNTHFAYYLVMAMPTPDDWLYGAKITYHYSTAGD